MKTTYTAYTYYIHSKLHKFQTACTPLLTFTAFLGFTVKKKNVFSLRITVIIRLCIRIIGGVSPKPTRFKSLFHPLTADVRATDLSCERLNLNL